MCERRSEGNQPVLSPGPYRKAQRPVLNVLSEYTIRSSRPRFLAESTFEGPSIEPREAVIPRRTHEPIRSGVVRAKTRMVLAAWYRT